MYSIKYLGVTIIHGSRWNTPRTEANRTLGFLRRNLYQYPQGVKVAAYKGLCSPVFFFFCFFFFFFFFVLFVFFFVCFFFFFALRKHAYSNIMNISPPKTENFQIKNSDIFHISAQKHRL